MIDGIPVPLVELTPWGLLGLAFLLLMLGKLVPSRMHSALEAEKEYWRDTATKSAATVAVQAETIRVQTEAAEFSRKVMEAIQQNAGRSD